MVASTWLSTLLTQRRMNVGTTISRSPPSGLGTRDFRTGWADIAISKSLSGSDNKLDTLVGHASRSSGTRT